MMTPNGSNCTFILFDVDKKGWKFTIPPGKYLFNNDGCLSIFTADGKSYFLRNHYETWWEKMLVSINNPKAERGSKLALSKLTQLGLNRMGLPENYAGPVAKIATELLKQEIGKLYPSEPEGYYTAVKKGMLAYTPVIHYKDCLFVPV